MCECFPTSDCNSPFSSHIAALPRIGKKTNTFIAVHITKSQGLILLPCKSEMLVSTNAILFVYSDSASAHFGDNAPEREGGRKEKADIKDPKRHKWDFNQF